MPSLGSQKSEFFLIVNFLSAKLVLCKFSNYIYGLFLPIYGALNKDSYPSFVFLFLKAGSLMFQQTNTFLKRVLISGLKSLDLH